MFDKHIRVLIIEPVFAQAHLIEKMLNLMGYYCVATTANVEEGLLLNRYGLRNFDVLIAPLPMLVLEHSQVSRFKGFNIRNLFLYGCSPQDHDIPILVKGEACFKSGLPEYEVLQEFMARFPISGGQVGALSVRG
jgi:hypothetical protein